MSRRKLSRIMLCLTVAPALADLFAGCAMQPQRETYEGGTPKEPTAAP